MLAHVHDKGEGEVDDDGGAEGDKGSVDKEQADARGGHPQPFTQVGTDPKSIALEEMLDFKC